METGLRPEQRAALHAAAAGAAGALLFYAQNNLRVSSSITGFFWNMLFIFVLYLCIPFVFARFFFAAFGYAVDVVRGAAELYFLSVLLCVGALAAVFYVVVIRQEGLVLLTSGALFLLRLVWHLLG